jgi:hypothetical protein
MKNLSFLRTALFVFVFLLQFLYAQDTQKVFPGADESTPSRTMYFDWVNTEWHGGREAKIMANLDFFKFMHDEYGMNLDIYLMDAANLDNGPECVPVAGAPAYGRFDGDWFLERFPNGLEPIVKKAASFGARMGMWMGPDGFGETAEDAKARVDMLVSLTKDYNFMLFKYDACASDLRPEKEKYFIQTLADARKYSPDLIALNHRITLSDEARAHTTTFLWEGAETYVDVHVSSDQPAFHHRRETLSRSLPPDLRRLTEDHGVCISSCLDFWEDEVVLQAFNRNLILAPELYGNPWLLRDEEFPKLARLVNLAKRYSDIMVKGMVLPESEMNPKFDGPYDYEYFEGEFTSMPNFDKLTAVKTGQTNTLDVSERDRNINFAFRLKGQVDIPVDGKYTFGTFADDGCMLFIDGKAIIDNGAGLTRNTQNQVELKKGRHDLVVTYYQGLRGYNLRVWGKSPPEYKLYGPYAVSRGDDKTRLITLRNISSSWEPVNYRVKLDASLGLKKQGRVELRRLHPSEKLIGIYDYGTEVDVEVLPLRSSLLIATSGECKEIGISGTDYEVIREVEGKPVVIKLLGMPGTKKTISLLSGGRKFSSATIEGKQAKDLINGKTVNISFKGKSLDKMWHRKLGDLKPVELPSDAEGLYEATAFAADNNALEARSLKRSGATKIPQVKAARDAYFEDPVFVKKGIWDKYAFDGDLKTAFKFRVYTNQYLNRTRRVGQFRLDFGDEIALDKLLMVNVDTGDNELKTIQVSNDLKSWKRVDVSRKADNLEINLTQVGKIRYLRTDGSVLSVSEIEGYNEKSLVPRINWRATNLFRAFTDQPVTKAWSKKVTFNEVPSGSYLAVKVSGHYGKENAYAALRVDGEFLGAPDRTISYQSNTWEYPVRQARGNYTYLFPITEDMQNKDIEVFVLGFEAGENIPEQYRNLYKAGLEKTTCEAWITTYPIPFEEKELVLR